MDLSVAETDPSALDGYRILDMGTEFDHLGVLATPRREERYVREGKLMREQVANRRLLREVMVKAGFRMIPNEWWHFDISNFRIISKKYRLIR